MSLDMKGKILRLNRREYCPRKPALILRSNPTSQTAFANTWGFIQRIQGYIKNKVTSFKTSFVLAEIYRHFEPWSIQNDTG